MGIYQRRKWEKRRQINIAEKKKREKKKKKQQANKENLE